jgi:SSS family solute:Na+ symporter
VSSLDWAILFVPLVIVLFMGWRVQRHMRAVSDFLVGGRLAGRYLVAVGSGEAAMGLITVVAMFEMYYRSGFALGFWNGLATPLMLVATLTGFAVYRYRETRALTMAQFFEIRYSRGFRIFAGALAWAAGVLNYAVFPAVGGRFIIHYCQLPESVVFGGFVVPTLGLVMAAFLSLAVLLVMLGGHLTTMVTDSLSGVMSYAMYAVVIVTVLTIFGFSQMQGALLDRPPGKSMLNPFDTHDLTQFNVFFILVGILSGLYNLLSWQGTQAYNAAAASPHEQRMGMVLGVWRSSLSIAMILLLSVAAYTYMHHPDFSSGAQAVTSELTTRINLDSAAAAAQIREQMLVPVAIRHFLPVGVVGLFCAVMVLMLVSTDTTYLHSWGSIFVQDVFMPWFKRTPSPRAQIWMLRLSILSVALFAFLWSLWFNQLTYILMLFALTGAVYLGGAGAVILGGLYWRRGTAAGAWAALSLGAMIALTGLLCTQLWPGTIHPYLLAHAPEALARAGELLHWLGDALPFVEWEVSPERFPISGQEIYFLSMATSVFAYVVVSLATCRAPFDMDRLLHRGRYRVDEVAPATAADGRRFGGWRKLLLGWDEQFSRGDRILSLSVFSYSMGLFAIWSAAVAWNLLVHPFSSEEWATYFWVINIGLALAVGAVTSVWFTIGVFRDLRSLFARLAKANRDASDNGQVRDGSTRRSGGPS